MTRVSKLFRPSPTAVRLGGTVLAAVLLVLAGSAPAFGHNQLVSASPDRDTTVTRAPAELVLRFLNRVDPAFTTVVVTDSSQRRITTAAPIFDGPKATVPFAQQLGNGTYTVAYRTVSDDGHPIQGSYRFTVADPHASAAPTTAARPATTNLAAAARPSSDSNRRSNVIFGSVLVLVLIGTVAGLLWWRRSRAA